jgi:prefoldin subunit 5
MAANEYVKAAASQLQNAATAVKSEIDQMRADLMTYEREVQKDIDSKEMDMHANNMRRSREQPDATDVALLARLKWLQNYIDDKKKELERRKAEVANAIREKEAGMQNLKSQANGLESQAANFK